MSRLAFCHKSFTKTHTFSEVCLKLLSFSSILLRKISYFKKSLKVDSADSKNLLAVPNNFVDLQLTLSQVLQLYTYFYRMCTYTIIYCKYTKINN